MAARGHQNGESDGAGRVVAITGARTFLGSELCRRLEIDPTIERVVALDIKKPDVAGEGTTFINLDLTNPGAHSDLAAALHEHNVDTVVHGAFLTYPTHARSWAHELEDIGTLHVLDACEKVMPERLIMLSSTLVYGARKHNPNYLDEDAPLTTDTEPRYIADKVRAEKQVADFAERHPLCKVGVLRFAPLVGPSVFNWITRLLSKPFALRLVGRDPLVQLVHQSDAIAALSRAVETGVRGPLNIVGKGVLPYSTVLALLGRIPLPLPYTFARPLARLLWTTQVAKVPPEFVDFLRYLCVADGSRAERELGFRPRFDTKNTLLDFLGVDETGEPNYARLSV